MRWTDVYEIAIELVDSKPDVDPLTVNFVQLRDWIIALPDFEDDPERCGEKILEAIQAAWIEELDQQLYKSTSYLCNNYLITKKKFP